MCWTSFNHLREMASIFFPVSNRNTMITSTGRGCAVLEAATTHEHVRENGKQKHRFITCVMSPNNPASNSMSTSVIPDMAAASTSLLKKRGKTPNPNESPSSELCPEDVVSDKQIGGGDGGDSVCAGGGGARIVAVNPNPRKCTASKLIDLVEELIIKLFHDGSEFPATLTGNFATVAEETPPRGDLTVRGRIPECLSGEFIRIGPNPMFVPVAGYSWFDGDGMAHGMRFKDGKVTYVSRYVRTSRLRQEELFGGAKFIKVGDINGLFGIALLVVQVLRLTFKIFDMSYGFGTANTALVYHDGKLLALHEADKPYVIGVLENGDLQTLGMQDYDKRLAHSFTAHPKIDPCTGEMFTYGYSWVPARITYRVVSKDGFMHDPVPITIPAPILSHDFAITENYVIFMDLPLRFTPKDMMQNKQAFLYDATVNARFGILSRYAKDEHSIKWFELPACFIFHAANAWEDGKEVVLITCRTENPALDLLDAAIKGIGTTEFELYEMRFNVSTGLASQKKLSASSVEFPRINEKFIGRKQRYVYTALLKGHGIRGIAKFDLHAEPDESKLKVEVGGNVQGIYQLNSGEFGSEPVFIPRQPGSNSEEDDGYLVFFAHNENTGKSSVYIIDAKTMSADPVAVIELPRRVPYGFHACFVTEEQLREQTLV